MNVESIDTYLCKDWLLHKHYAKRVPPIEYSFGLFINGYLQGCCTFGTPVSNTLRNLWNNQYKLIELNRLVVNDGLEKNTLSFFVSQCLKKLPKPLVIVSYADISKNHHGYIYQATNWKYTGLSKKMDEVCVKGMEHLHSGSIFDLSRGQKNRFQWLRDKYGDDYYLRERSRKHRYFYFIGNKKDVKKMILMNPYKIIPYPKGDNKRYDSSYNPIIQFNLFQ